MPAPRKKKDRSAPPPAPPPAATFEMAGDRLKVYSLQTLLTNKSRPETRAAARLGDVLLPWFEKVIWKPAQKLDGITELWQSLVPEKLRDRVRLLGFSRGILSVAADSAIIRSEIDALLRGGLLRQLQNASHGTIFKVKTCIEAPPEGHGR